MPIVTLLFQKKVWQCTMAASKKKGDIAQGGSPKREIRAGGYPQSEIRIGGNPDSYLSFHPMWRFAACDIDEKSEWSFYKNRLINEFWDEIFPKLRQFESMTWDDIFIKAKKQNHSIRPEELNKCARDRLVDMRIEPEAIHSLRLGGKLRIYGFMDGATYNILWYDNDHGDNENCVCRSTLRHT